MPEERDVVTAAEELKNEIKGLKTSVIEVDNRRKKSILGLWIVIVGLIFSIGLNLNIGYQNNNLSKQNNNLLHLVKDATDPSGQIYRRGQQNQVDAIRQLICDNHKLHGDVHPANLNCP